MSDRMFASAPSRRTAFGRRADGSQHWRLGWPPEWNNGHPQQDAEKPTSPVIPRSPPFLLADDQESRKSFVSRERFLSVS